MTHSKQTYLSIQKHFIAQYAQISIPDAQVVYLIQTISTLYVLFVHLQHILIMDNVQYAPIHALHVLVILSVQDALMGTYQWMDNAFAIISASSACY